MCKLHNLETWSPPVMSRFLLLFLGAFGAFAAWTLINEKPAAARKPMPAKQAAELLQEAWADHHTRA